MDMYPTTIALFVVPRLLLVLIKIHPIPSHPIPFHSKKKAKQSKAKTMQPKKRPNHEGEAASCRRSARPRKSCDRYYQEVMVSHGFVESKTDEQRGLDQPGLIHTRSEEERTKSLQEIHGYQLFCDYLRPNGWVRKKRVKSSNGYVFSPVGMLQKDEVHCTNMFYSYAEISEKFEKDGNTMDKILEGNCKVLPTVNVPKTKSIGTNQDTGSKSNDEDLICVVCRDPFSTKEAHEPVASPCGHSLCRNCILGWKDSQTLKRAKHMPCPVCKWPKAFVATNLNLNKSALDALKAMNSGSNSNEEATFMKCKVCTVTFSTDKTNPLTPVLGKCGCSVCRDCMLENHKQAMQYKGRKDIKNIACPCCEESKSFHADRLNRNVLLCDAMEVFNCHLNDPRVTNSNGGNDDETLSEMEVRQRRHNAHRAQEIAVRRESVSEDASLSSATSNEPSEEEDNAHQEGLRLDNQNTEHTMPATFCHSSESNPTDRQSPISSSITISTPNEDRIAHVAVKQGQEPEQRQDSHNAQDSTSGSTLPKKKMGIIQRLDHLEQEGYGLPSDNEFSQEKSEESY